MHIDQGAPVATNVPETVTATPAIADTTASNHEANASVAQAPLVCNILIIIFPVSSYSRNIFIVLYRKKSAIKRLISSTLRA